MNVRRSAVFNYFTLTNNNYYICDVEVKGVKCKAKISCKISKEFIGRYIPNRTSNLKRHLSRFHKEIFDIVERHDSNLKPKRKTGENDILPFFDTTPQPEVSIYMTKELFGQSIIDMIVKHGIPLSFFSSEAFQNINGELAWKVDISLDVADIRDMIIGEAQARKEDFKNSLKGKHFYLKIDECTFLSTKYFAMNVQYINHEQEVTMKTLTIMAYEDDGTISNVIETVLKEYDIDKSQILAVITDNASNMIETDFMLKDEDPTDIKYELDYKFKAVEHKVLEIKLPALKSFETDLNIALDSLHLNHMNCAVLLFHNALNDSLKDPKIAPVLCRIRSFAKTLQAPAIADSIKSKNGKSSIVDQPNKWSTTYLMVLRLFELKNILTQMAHPEVSMTENEWDEVEQIQLVFEFPYLTTKTFQEVLLTPGLFFKEWREVIYRLDRMGGPFATTVKSSLEFKETELVNNDLFIAGIFVDPQYRILLNETQVKRAKSTLCKKAIQIRQWIPNPEGTTCPEVQPTPMEVEKAFENPNDNDDDDDDDDYDFEKILDAKERVKRRRKDLTLGLKGTSAESENFEKMFFHALKDVEDIDRTSKITVKEAIPDYPEIVQEVAWVLTGFPTTQVSFERFFSWLHYAKSDLRESMKDDLLDAILYLRTNLDCEM